MARQTKPRVPTIRIPLYDVIVAVFINGAEEAEKQYESYFGTAPPEPFDGFVGLTMGATEIGHAAIYLAPDASHGTIAHESVHLAHFILHRAGVECTPENDEALCYLVTYIVDEIHAVYKKARKTVRAPTDRRH